MARMSVEERNSPGDLYEAQAQRLLADHLVVAGVFVDAKFNLLFSRGEVHRYLDRGEGLPTVDLKQHSQPCAFVVFEDEPPSVALVAETEDLQNLILSADIASLCPKKRCEARMGAGSSAAYCLTARRPSLHYRRPPYV